MPEGEFRRLPDPGPQFIRGLPAPFVAAFVVGISMRETTESVTHPDPPPSLVQRRHRVRLDGPVAGTKEREVNEEDGTPLARPERNRLDEAVRPRTDE